MHDEFDNRSVVAPTEIRECRHCSGTSMCQYSTEFVTRGEQAVDGWRYTYYVYRECSCCGKGLTLQGTFDVGDCDLSAPPPHCGVCGGRGMSVSVRELQITRGKRMGSLSDVD
jgi:hypothetical protein